jgi:hypothetical protein
MNRESSTRQLTRFPTILIGIVISFFIDHDTASSLSKPLVANRIDQVIPGIEVKQLVGRILKRGTRSLGGNEWSSSLGDESGLIDILTLDSCSQHIQKGASVCVEGYCQSQGGHLRLIITSMRQPTPEESEKLTDDEDGWLTAFGSRHPNNLSGPRRSYGCLLIRGRRCVLVRSLEHPPRWPGLRIPNAPAQGTRLCPRPFAPIFRCIRASLNGNNCLSRATSCWQ